MKADDVPVRVAQRSLDHVDVDFAAPGWLMLLDRFVRLAGLQHVPVITLVLFCQFGGEKVEIGFADNLFEGSSQGSAKLLVGKGKTELEIFAEDVLRQSLDQRMI